MTHPACPVEAVHASGLFDANWYRQHLRDALPSECDPLLHFLHEGWRAGYDPGPDFQCNAYLRARPDLAATGRNPLLHYLGMRNGMEYDILGDPALADLKLTNREVGLLLRSFDATFYLSQPGADNPVGHGPLRHFLQEGWRIGLAPNRWFDPLGYMVEHHLPAETAGNPFLHYLRHGLDEGHRPMPYFLDRTWSPPALQRRAPAEYGPISRILPFAAARAGDKPPCPAPTEQLYVHVHLFHREMTEAICRLLQNLPEGFTLMVSVRPDVSTGMVEHLLHQRLPGAARIVVRATANRGRDVAGWLVAFKDMIEQTAAEDGLFLHLHTKRSGHDTSHRGWFRYLGHTILGSPAIAARILDLFSTDPGLGLLAPGYWPGLRRAPNFGECRPQYRSLMARMGLEDDDPFCPDFPAGSFFWCRSRMLRPLLNLGLDDTDFPPEQGQICGTPAHAIERIIGALPAAAGLRADFIAIDLPYEQARHQPVFAPREVGPTGEMPTVSAILLLGDNSAAVLHSINSVLRQDHQAVEILLAGAAETVPTTVIEALIAAHRDDLGTGRLRFTLQPGAAFQGARNAALVAARGDILAYLDAGETWPRDHLARVAAAHAARPDVPVSYSDALLPANERDRLYDRAQLLTTPWLPLTACAHRRRLTDKGLRFDPRMGPLADWDFLLAATTEHAPMRVTGPASPDAPPCSFKRPPSTQSPGFVWKHRAERLYWGFTPLRIALKVPAPKPEFAHRWGDFHLANSLARAFERLGCITRVDLQPDWYSAAKPEDDVAIVFRGVTRYEPDPQRINLMWHISHPDRVELEEMARFDHVFISSHRYASTIVGTLKSRASSLLQCSDPEIFTPPGKSAQAEQNALLFVGNSRKTQRWMPQLCVERGLPIAVYGAEWDGLLPAEVLHGTHIPNTALAEHYGRARIVLNDHWPDMAAKGFVSNRIFDAGLAGAMVISDHFEGSEIFFGNVVTCATPDEAETAIRHYLTHEEARREKAQALRRIVLANHTVDQRAEAMLKVIHRIADQRRRNREAEVGTA